MRKALDLLESQRVLTRRQGRGTFINDQNSAEMAQRYNKLRGPDGRPVVSHPEVGPISEGVASELEGRRLGLEPDARVYRFTRTYFREHRAFMLDEVTVPAAAFPGLEKQREVATDVVTLAQRYGLLTGSAAERITTAPADDIRAGMLNVAPGAPLLNFDRVVFELNGLPLEWRLGYCHLASGYYLAALG
jgi:GntR family transcriptional regulator